MRQVGREESSEAVKRPSDLPKCRLCLLKRPSKRQTQIHKGICAREAARVGWVKPLTDPLYSAKCAVVNASLAFHEAYHYHGQPPRPYGSVDERKAWDKAIETLKAAIDAAMKAKAKPSAKGAGRG